MKKKKKDDRKKFLALLNQPIEGTGSDGRLVPCPSVRIRSDLIVDPQNYDWDLKKSIIELQKRVNLIRNEFKQENCKECKFVERCYPQLYYLTLPEKTDISILPLKDFVIT